MKQTALIIFAITWLFSMQAISQDFIHNTDKRSGLQTKSVTDLECPPGNLYSQSPNDGSGSWTGGENYFADNILTETLGVETISWWMHEQQQAVQTFDIHLLADNDGLPGALITSYLGVSATAVNTGEAISSNPIYLFTYTLPSPIDIPAGTWLGLKTYPTDGFYYHFLSSDDGDGSIVVLNGNHQVAHVFSNPPTNMAFCLGTAQEPQAVPLSSWPLVVGLLLITGFILLRSRRIL